MLDHLTYSDNCQNNKQIEESFSTGLTFIILLFNKTGKNTKLYYFLHHLFHFFSSLFFFFSFSFPPILLFFILFQPKALRFIHSAWIGWGWISPSSSDKAPNSMHKYYLSGIIFRDSPYKQIQFLRIYNTSSCIFYFEVLSKSFLKLEKGIKNLPKLWLKDFALLKWFSNTSVTH